MSRNPAETPAAAFGEAADPAAYVPRTALESALAELSALLDQPPPACAAFVGEPGLGKTLLLRVLAQRLERSFDFLYVPFPRLDPVEFWAWVAAELGLARSDDDRATVLKRARGRAASGRGIVLLVDDAGVLPPETRIELVAACRTPGFSVVMAFTPDDQEPLTELPEHVRRIQLGPPMTLAETRAYVFARLRPFDPDGRIAGLLGPERMAELHEAAGGVPARLHGLLEPWLRRMSGEPSPIPVREPPPAPAAAPLLPEAPPVEHAAPEYAAPLPGAPRRESRPRSWTGRALLGLAAALVGLVAGLVFVSSQRRTEVVAAPPAAPSERAETPAEPTPLPPVAAAPPEPATAEPAPAATAPPETPPPEPSLPPVDAAPPEPSLPAPAAPTAAAPAREARAEEPPRATAAAALPLAPPPAGPRLNVNAEPWAEITLDGRPIGQTPLGELPVTPGSHRVTATLPDGRVLERSFEARGGDVYVVFR